MLYEYSVLGDILFICVEFIRVQVEQGKLDRVGKRRCRDSLFCYGSWVGVWVGDSQVLSEDVGRIA